MVVTIIKGYCTPIKGSKTGGRERRDGQQKQRAKTQRSKHHIKQQLNDRGRMYVSMQNLLDLSLGLTASRRAARAYLVSHVLGLGWLIFCMPLFNLSVLGLGHHVSFFVRQVCSADAVIFFLCSHIGRLCIRYIYMFC